MRDGDSYGGYRTRLVETLQQKGIRDLAVLRAIGTVPRHLFVPESVRHRAYEDSALPIAMLARQGPIQESHLVWNGSV